MTMVKVKGGCIKRATTFEENKMGNLRKAKKAIKGKTTLMSCQEQDALLEKGAVSVLVSAGIPLR